MSLARRGFARFGPEPGLSAWAAAARAQLRPAMDDPANARWWRCGGTWFVGVDALGNDARGALPGGPPLAGTATAMLRARYGAFALHRAQLSVTRPGYPLPDPGESPSAARFRRDRDAAHVDGLLPVGAARRRMLREPHAYILGLPLTEADPGASPLVAWEGSHRIMRAAFRRALAGHPPDRWSGIDLTDTYREARREVFARCRRVPLPAGPGEAIVLHRLTLHGVAPWTPGARAAAPGRAVAYFRPLTTPRRWLSGD